MERGLISERMLKDKLLTLQEIGDNNIFIGYESSLGCIQDVREVNVNDFCVMNIGIGIVTEVILQKPNIVEDLDTTEYNDLKLSAIRVKFENINDDLRTGKPISGYEEKLFVFDGSILESGSTVDTSRVNVTDMSSIRIIKRSTDTYKTEIEKIQDRIDSKRN